MLRFMQTVLCPHGRMLTRGQLAITQLFLLSALCSAAAGPIKTEIWEGAVQNAECVGQHSSAFDPFVQHSHKVVGALTKQPGWFLPASAVGQKVCKVGGLSYSVKCQLSEALSFIQLAVLNDLQRTPHVLACTCEGLTFSLVLCRSSPQEALGCTM